MLKRLSQREKILCGITAAVVGFIIFYHFALGPLWAHSKALNREMALKKQRVERSQELLAQRESIQKEARRYEKYHQEGISQEAAAAAFLEEIGHRTPSISESLASMILANSTTSSPINHSCLSRIRYFPSSL